MMSNNHSPWVAFCANTYHNATLWYISYWHQPYCVIVAAVHLNVCTFSSILLVFMRENGLWTMHLFSSQKLEMNLMATLFLNIMNMRAAHSLLSCNSSTPNLTSLSTFLSSYIAIRKFLNNSMTFCWLLLRCWHCKFTASCRSIFSYFAPRMWTIQLISSPILFDMKDTTYIHGILVSLHQSHYAVRLPIIW